MCNLILYAGIQGRFGIVKQVQRDLFLYMKVFVISIENPSVSKNEDLMSLYKSRFVCVLKMIQYRPRLRACSH